MAEVFDLGNVLQTAEAIKGSRTVNALNQQRLQQGAASQQNAQLINQLTAEAIQNPNPQTLNALLAASPEAAQQLFTAQQGGQTVEQGQFKLERQEADTIISIGNAALKAPNSTAFLKLAAPTYIQGLKEQGVNIDDLSDAETDNLIRQTMAQSAPFATPGLDTQRAQEEATLAQTTEATARAGREEQRDIVKAAALAKKEEGVAQRAAAKAARDAAKAKSATDKVEAARVSNVADLRSTKSSLSRLISHPGLSAATGRSAAFPTIPGGEAANFEALIDTIKARLGFAELAKMRANSPSGGALGQISERELKFLQSANQSLDVSQSEEQFVENVRLIDESLDRLLEAQEAAALGEDVTLEFQEGDTATGPAGEQIVFKDGQWQTQ